MYEISVDCSFSAAHALRHYRGKCEQVHGHNYKVRVTVAGEKLDETGLLIDFADLRSAITGVASRLDHQFLNELPPFDRVNPSAENLARHFYDEVAKQVGTGLRLSQVTVWETDVSSATYRPTP
jgi:6-pyruvoyltetrahydropterin/6-carboxytetrahydropterin synthase